MRQAVRLAVLVVAFVTARASAQAPPSLADSAFAQLIANFSERPGFFDTDNLISNEDSYLHPVTALKRIGGGGAYLGVGPDQNYSYIAAVRPRIAFVVDIRRDNMLQHLLFKAAFSLARNRVEYLCLLFGIDAPADTAGWGARDISAVLAYVDGARRDSATASRIRAQVLARVRRTAVPLAAADLATIARFHQTFIANGPALRFNTFGRAPQPYYPDLRRLLTETDRTGRQSNYAAHEADFQFVKSLHDRNLIIPVVGDFGGAKALVSVGAWLRARRETVSAFYTSNVEQYLFRSSAFDQFASNVAQLPRDARTLMVRSYFQGGHPNAVAGYHAVLVAQPMDTFVTLTANGALTSYYTLVTRGIIDR